MERILTQSDFTMSTKQRQLNDIICYINIIFDLYLGYVAKCIANVSLRHF